MSDTMSQTRLVRELRLALDELRPPHATHPPFFSAPEGQQQRALGRLEKLIRENPRSIHSTHVRYNLGRRRSDMLDQLVGHFDAEQPTRAARSDGEDQDRE
jgi:hypothetical protein